jgi:hypothetical protein
MDGLGFLKKKSTKWRLLSLVGGQYILLVFALESIKVITPKKSIEY